MKRLIRTALASLVAGATVAAGTVSASSAQAAEPRQVLEAVYDAGLARQHDQLVAIEHFRAVADADPDRIAGISTQGPDHVTVNLVDRPGVAAPDLSAIRREAATVGITISVQLRQHSLGELTRIRDAVTRDAALTAAAGAPVSASIDPDTNSVKIYAKAETAALRTKAQNLYGDAVVVSAADDVQKMLGRFNDSPAGTGYWGGDRIANPSGACTYGFSMTNAYGTKYGLTAGHCWSVGTGVSVARQYGGAGNNGTGYGTFGTVAFRRGADWDMDNELIGGQKYGGAIWTANDLANDSTVYSVVHDAHASCAGCNVYFDGSFSGKGLATVEAYRNCLGFDDGSVQCGLWSAKSTNGQRICQAGDSGGPVFAYDGRGGVTAVGIIEGGNASGTSCLYTDVPMILNYWQSHITTS